MKYSLVQKYLFFLIIGVLSLYSCRQSATTSRPDVSHIDVDVKIERFDRELAALEPRDVLSQNSLWQQQYGDFYRDYMLEMLEIGHPSDSLYIQDVLGKVIQKRDFIDLSAAVAAKYPDMAAQEAELQRALQYLKYYFPAYEVPRFITFVGGFSFQTPLGNDYVGIGLDMFLGADSEFYPALIKSIPLYVSRRFTPENIVPRVMETILREEIYPQEDGSVNTLSHMLYNGKILYAMDCILEEVSDETKIGYTAEQLAWAQRHEQDVWSWFVQGDLLYSTDYLRTQKYFSEAPFTPELGENNESAPKLGSYLGWMMVRKYMQNHPEMELKELFAIEDAQQVLEASKYRGK